MNDITALMATMKAAAESVIQNYDYEWFETGCQICTVHKSKVNLISLTSPANVRALVEALEKAQQQKESDFEIKARLCKESNGLHDRLREAEKRIAELESRTVTVELPPRVDSSNVPFTAHTWNCCLDAVEKRLTAAGIQVIEGDA